MPIATTGLVLRQVKLGEADQILTLLTPDLGVISASAKGSLRLKNKLFSACGHFSYSEFVLTSGRSHYFVDDAQVKKVFYGVSSTVEGLALASYMAEVAAELSPAPPEAEVQLRLLLNCLYMICEKKRPWRQLKAIYELRALCLAGICPMCWLALPAENTTAVRSISARLRGACSAPTAPTASVTCPTLTPAHCMPCAISA